MCRTIWTDQLQWGSFITVLRWLLNKTFSLECCASHFTCTSTCSFSNKFYTLRCAYGSYRPVWVFLLFVSAVWDALLYSMINKTGFRPLWTQPYTRKTALPSFMKWEFSNYRSPYVRVLSLLQQQSGKESIPVKHSTFCDALNNSHAYLHIWIGTKHPEQDNTKYPLLLHVHERFKVCQQQWGCPPQTWSASPNPRTGTQIQQGPKAWKCTPKEKGYSQGFAPSWYLSFILDSVDSDLSGDLLF